LLTDTLDAVSRTRVGRRVLVLDGVPGDWLPENVALMPQRHGSLDLRLAAAFEDVGGPALLIGMDTPQVNPALLEAALARLARGDSEAVLGTCPDGGWWALGLRHADGSVLRGLPMSAPWTARAQVNRLRGGGLRCSALPTLRDVDTFDDARAVATECPNSRFAAALGDLRFPAPASATPARLP
jgi:hypothetical protein